MRVDGTDDVGCGWLMSGFTFRRAADETKLPTEPGTYRRIVETWGRYHGLNGQFYWTEVLCPHCKRYAMIGSHHTVKDSGTVWPSWVCPHCPFHLFVQLGDWNRPGPRRIKT